MCVRARRFWLVNACDVFAQFCQRNGGEASRASIHATCADDDDDDDGDDTTNDDDDDNDDNDDVCCAC